MRRIWVPQLVAGLMLLWALNPRNPYGYYILLRWVCCGIFAYLAFKASDMGHQGWVWVVGITAAVYNPILRVHLTREIWSVVNVVTIGIAVASVFALRFTDEKRDAVLVWTAWNNGQHRRSGAGYGIKVPRADRDAWFQRSWGTVTVVLPTREGSQAVELNIAKSSFWTECRELISVEIGKWLIAQAVAPWPAGRPPRLEVVPEGPRRFVVRRVLSV